MVKVSPACCADECKRDQAAAACQTACVMCLAACLTEHQSESPSPAWQPLQLRQMSHTPRQVMVSALFYLLYKVKHLPSSSRSASDRVRKPFCNALTCSNTANMQALTAAKETRKCSSIPVLTSTAQPALTQSLLRLGTDAAWSAQHMSQHSIGEVQNTCSSTGAADLALSVS